MNRIKELRIEKGMTQSELGYLVGVSDASINKYEKGGMKPKIDKLEKMSEIFGVSISYIDGSSNLKVEQKAIDLLKKANSTNNTNQNKFELLTDGEDEFYMLIDYRSLNSEGKKLACKQISNLTKIEDYKE